MNSMFSATSATTTTSASIEMRQVFLASLSSVGTAAALAAAGFYLHRLGYITPEGKKTLSRYSQQVAIPALFFSKMVSCPSAAAAAPRQQQLLSSQEGIDAQTMMAAPHQHEDVCPSIWGSMSLQSAWLLILWPLFVVSCGFVVGSVACYLSQTPPWQRRSILVAIAFANSTGLPTTLLSVLQEHTSVLWQQGSSSQEHTALVDLNAVLSLYLVLYPMLQWGIGSWLLTHNDDNTVSNNREEESSPKRLDVEGMPLMLPEDDSDLLKPPASEVELLHHRPPSPTTRTLIATKQAADRDHEEGETVGTLELSDCSLSTVDSKGDGSVLPWCQAFFSKTVLNQPPIYGALLGLVVSCWPSLRQVFVQTSTGGATSHAPPLEWLLDAIRMLGQAAVPINMAVLGTNLSIACCGGGSSSSSSDSPPKRTIMSTTRSLSSSGPILAVVVGKLAAMPIIGIASVKALVSVMKHFGSEPPLSPVLLVLMIVFLTPTANTVMLMVELADGSKAEMARIMAWEYAFAPFVLSVTVAMAVHIAATSR